jgi:hypothetical protein
MAWVAIGGAVAGGLATGVVGNLLGGGGGGGGGSSGGYSGGSYLPPNLQQAANSELGMIPQLGQNNLYQQYLPQVQSAVNQGLYSPYYGQAMQGAQQASGAGMQQGMQSLGAANQLYGQMGQIPGLENQLIGSAFDPQSQLYNYLQAQNANQTNADLAARGLGMSGAGAQIADQQNQLFNQNWQNNLLQRQLAGAQGVGMLNQSAGQLGAIGTTLGTQGVNQIQQSAAMPYQTQLNSLQSQLGLMGTAGQYGQQSNVPIQQQISDYNAYQGLGSPSAQFGQQQTAMQGAASIAQPIGNALGGAIGNWAAGLGGSSNSGNYFGTGSGYNPNFMTLPGG